MSMDNSHWAKRDLSVLWHPCSQMKDHEEMPILPIKSASGVWLEDFEGNRYIDAISSWWVNLFGHSNAVINESVRKQLEKLEHVILAGFTHEAVIELSEKLVALTPQGLSRCFYADNGSAAVEVSLKMSFQYWQNLGQSNKTKFITLSNSYHGETLGALAVGDVALYKEKFSPLLMQAITVESPDCYFKEQDETCAEYSKRLFQHMEECLNKHADEVCAVIVEPLVQCAGNMRMYDPVYLQLLREACNRHNVHLIADEIAVGFGRTGSMFACEQAGVSPDFMCLSKGLTGGYLPLSVVLTTENVYDAFYDDYQSLKGFLHSHSYTGNALACSAALGTLKIFEEKDVIQTNQLLVEKMHNAVIELQDHPHVAEVRQKGMILAIEMAKNKSLKLGYDWQERRGLKVYRHGLQKGVLLRPLGNVVYFMPPYVINDDEIMRMSRAAMEGIHLATSE